MSGMTELGVRNQVVSGMAAFGTEWRLATVPAKWEFVHAA